MATISRTREQWRALVREFTSSRESAAAFAERHGVAESTLRWWCSAFRRERPATEVAFVDVVVDEKPTEPLSVVLAGAGHRVIVPAGFDAGELRRLVNALC